MISFNNTKQAFAYRTDSDLRRAKLLFTAVSKPFLVNTGGNLVIGAIKAGLPLAFLIKPTLYRHFVGGETIDECLKTVKRISEYGVSGILDFAAEGLDSEEKIEETLKETIRTIDAASISKDIPFSVFKPTAFILKSALDKIADGQTSDSSVEKALSDFERRVDTLCKHAFEKGVPIMIDAEESWYQDYFDEVVLKMMRLYNRESAIVYNTLQMYRHDRAEYLKELDKIAESEGFKIGIKFVRGAYMEKERLRAAKLSYPSPICADKDETDKLFNEGLAFCVKRIEKISIFNGTHNEYSSYLLCRLIEENNISKNDSRIWFSQLYGMSDHISFNLAAAGYNVAKYLPYGPVKLLIPYLFRRAQENTSVAGQTGRELSLLKTEIRRRRVKGQNIF